MKAANHEWKLCEDRLQQWLQPRFANDGRAAHNLPLRYFVHRVDVIHTLHTRSVALMHRVHSQVTGPTFRHRPTPLSNPHRCRPRLAEVGSLPAVRGSFAQTVNLCRRNRRQTLIVAVAIFVVFPFQNLPRRWSAQSLVCLIHTCQQRDIGARVPVRKTMSPVPLRFYRSPLSIARNESRDLCPAHPGHLRQIPPQQAFRSTSLLPVLMLLQYACQPFVNLLSLFCRELPFLARFQKLLDLLQAQFLLFLHPDVQYPACRLLPKPLQAHLA